PNDQRICQESDILADRPALGSADRLSATRAQPRTLGTVDIAPTCKQRPSRRDQVPRPVDARSVELGAASRPSHDRETRHCKSRRSSRLTLIDSPSPDDLIRVADVCLATLEPVGTSDWSVRAGELDWSCRQTVE